jgi:EpsI family protein
MSGVVRSVVLGVSMCLAAWVGYAMIPHESMQARLPRLDRLVPERFGAWVNVPSPMVQVDVAVNESGAEKSIESPYDETVMRTYVNRQTGEAVMLALAYGRQQHQEIKIHRPELCYYAQGAAVSDLRLLRPDELRGAVPEGAKSMLGVMPDHVEEVLYWIRIGDVISRSAIQTRGYIFKEGLKGVIPDGVLVRSSQALQGRGQVAHSLEVQQEFLNEMIAAVPPNKRHLFLPTSD